MGSPLFVVNQLLQNENFVQCFTATANIVVWFYIRQSRVPLTVMLFRQFKLCQNVFWSMSIYIRILSLLTYSKHFSNVRKSKKDRWYVSYNIIEIANNCKSRKAFLYPSGLNSPKYPWTAKAISFDFISDIRTLKPNVFMTKHGKRRTV